MNDAQQSYEVVVRIKQKDYVRYNRYIVGSRLRPARDTFRFIGTYKTRDTILDRDALQDS